MPSTPLTLRLNIDMCIRPLIIYRLVTVQLPSQSEFILSLDEFGNRYYCDDKEIATTLLRMFMTNLIQKFEKKHYIQRGFTMKSAAIFFCRLCSMKFLVNLLQLSLPLLGKHMVVSSQNPHQPYTEKLFHHLLLRESGNWKKTKI